jgi:L-alanine-DL-glutamate epimerase-like enolase superfamily enzyme
MRISNASAWIVRMALKEPYVIAYETIHQAENVFLKIETRNGPCGYGCAAPDPQVTKETARDVLDIAQTMIIPTLEGRDPLRLAAILDHLKSKLNHNPSAMAMTDMALYDLLGKIARLPLFQLLGGFRQRMPTSITIGILPLEETLVKAEAYVRQGFKAIKVKGGRDVDRDIACIQKLSKQLAGKIKLRFDANQGYTSEQALYFAEHTRQTRLEVLEQPTPREDIRSLGRLTRKTEIPIMADESLMNLRDVFRLARRDLVDMVNIKLMKTGGIREALQVNAVAKAADIRAMVGCMDESALGIAAGLHFALSSPNVTHADLDGHLDLLDDPAANAVVLKDGMLYPSGRPGLGWQ